LLYQTIFGMVDSNNIADKQMKLILIKMKFNLSKAITMYKMLRERISTENLLQCITTGKFVHSTSNNDHSDLWNQFENCVSTYNWYANIIGETKLKRSDFLESGFTN